MVTIKRTNSENSDFIKLVAELDAELAIRDGEEHAFYNQFNSIQNLQHTVVLYADNLPFGCGAIKAFDENSMEVKRMYVPSTERGKGYATQILQALEQWAHELGKTRCVLETGKKQPEAIALYKKNGYEIIKNYEQYIGVKNSVCFEKQV